MHLMCHYVASVYKVNNNIVRSNYIKCIFSTITTRLSNLLVIYVHVHCNKWDEAHSHLLRLHDITNFVRLFYFIVKFACMKIVYNVIITALYMSLSYNVK